MVDVKDMQSIKNDMKTANQNVEKYASTNPVSDLSVNANTYKRCLRCGRRLRTEESQQIGYGSVCLLKMKNSVVKKLWD